MISTIKEGLLIKKIPYKEKHEILHILLETGNVESFFLENGQKSKKNKSTVPSKISITYFKNNGINKILTLDIEDYYQEIVSDMLTFMYVGNIVELITILGNVNIFMEYSQFEKILHKLNCKYIDVQLVNAYFICKLLINEGFKFKYKRINSVYKGYDFSLNIFTDVLNKNIYPLSDRLIKLIHILNMHSDTNIFESITLTISEYSQLLDFLNQIMKEYVGIETKMYNKIQDLEFLMYNIERKNNHE